MHHSLPIQQQAINQQLTSTINARNLHQYLNIGKDFSTWIKDRIASYKFVEQQDYICSPNWGSKGSGGHNRLDYFLALDMAKELAMVERNERGKQARQYFIECEKRLQQQAPLKLLEDPYQLRNLLLQYSETTVRLENEMKEQQPKVEFFHRVADAENAQSIQEIAKVLKVGPKIFFAYLRRIGLLMRDNIPYQKYINLGYFRVVESTYVKDQTSYINSRTFVTGKGLIRIEQLLKKSPVRADELFSA